MGKKRLLAVAFCAAAITGLSATSAFAGEVKGPPGSSDPADPNLTGAPAHANSICAFSGQNDGDPPAGRKAEHVQNWGQIPKEERDFLATIGFHPGDSCNGNSGFLAGG